MLNSTKPSMEFSFVDATAALGRLAANLATVIRGQQRPLRLLVSACIGGGHCLIEDFPGTGKTTLAKALAASIQADFQRIQFTPDLLPTDILGVSIYDQNERAFHFRQGPVFTQILLADEINRASPRTQSALLESMAEGQVSVEGRSQSLGELFFVIATQNPVELHGTFPLPEAQMDRFALRFALGYLDEAEEMEVLSERRESDPLRGIQPCGSAEGILAIRRLAARMPISAEVQRYIVRLVQETRRTDGVALGASPRASLALMKIAQALALFDGLDFVTPDHVQELAVPVLAHRLVLDHEARFSGRTTEAVVGDILQRIAPPR